MGMGKQIGLFSDYCYRGDRTMKIVMGIVTLGEIKALFGIPENVLNRDPNFGQNKVLLHRPFLVNIGQNKGIPHNLMRGPIPFGDYSGFTVPFYVYTVI